MAIAPLKKDVLAILEENQQEHDKKVKTQAAQGKSFNVPADGHGSGVIPEKVWQSLPGKTTGTF